jgi:hypothetical protein
VRLIPVTPSSDPSLKHGSEREMIVDSVIEGGVAEDVEIRGGDVLIPRPLLIARARWRLIASGDSALPQRYQRNDRYAASPSACNGLRALVGNNPRRDDLSRHRDALSLAQHVRDADSNL